METTRALEILKKLADGADPATGQVFPPNSPYQQADVTRALFVAVQTLQRPGFGQRRPDLPENVGKAWSPEEDQQLAAEFDRGLKAEQLAAAHKRTKLAVTARLEKLGKIPPSPETAARLRERQAAAATSRETATATM